MTTPAQAPPGVPDATSPDEDLSVDPEDRDYQRMSLRGPAIIVVGIAAFILVGGVLATILTAGNNPVLALHSIRIPDGTVVQLTPATTALKPIISSEPPADILSALAVPTGSVARHWINIDQNQTQYDRSVSFTTGLSSDQVVDVYKTGLPKLGWKLSYQGQGTFNGVSGTEMLARRASGDGYYWEVGVIVPPATSSGVTPFTMVVLEQNTDE
ncbi:MAG TPA: hypothetical protein VG014_05250 [Acidimicrobiales bacterium]|nr:hypothetical protein [Acidimicrobiales bacterium]